MEDRWLFTHVNAWRNFFSIKNLIGIILKFHADEVAPKLYAETNEKNLIKYFNLNI